MAGAGKRSASLVPQPQRDTLDKLSKATLMELLWDYAQSHLGFASDESLLANILDTNKALDHYRTHYRPHNRLP